MLDTQTNYSGNNGTNEIFREFWIRDIVINLLKKSIKLAEDKNPRYYMDYLKIHKLLYLAQCYCYYCYDLDLLRQPIIAVDHGPYIDNLNFVVANFGFEEIKNIDEYTENKAFLRLPFLRQELLDLIQEKFGIYNTSEIVKITKNTFAYKQSILSGEGTEISKELMKQTGAQIDKIIKNPNLANHDLYISQQVDLIIDILKNSEKELLAPKTKKRELGSLSCF